MTASLPSCARSSSRTPATFFVSPTSTLLAMSVSLLLAACGGGGTTDPGTGSTGNGPVIGTQPKAATVFQGQSATFTTATTDTAATYQWRLNGTAATNGPVGTGVCSGATVAGATTATMTLSGAPLTCDKSTITVALTSAGGTTVSSAAPLTVVGFTTQPANKAAFANGEVTMTAATNGPAALAYQWKINDADVTDGAVGAGACSGAVASGASTATIKLTNVPASCNDASLVVVASLNGASLPSQAGKIAVTAVTAAPAASTVLAGGSATFNVATSGATSGVTYAWAIDGQPVVNGPVGAGVCSGAVIAGATTATLTVASAPVGCHNAAVTATLTNASDVKLTTTAVPLNVAGFGSQPVAPAAFAAGTDAVLSAPTGGANLSSSTQWFLNGSALGNGIEAGGPCGGMTVAGANTATLTLSNIPATCNGTAFTATLSNSLGTVSTAPVTLAVAAGDVKNGTYKAFAANGKTYDVVVDFTASKFKIRDGATTLLGTLTPNVQPNGSAQPGTYTMSKVGLVGLAGAFRYRDDVIVGNVQPADGADAIPFIGARVFVRAASDVSSTLDFKVMGREFNAAPAAPDSSILTGQFSGSTFAFCSGNAISEVATCAAASNTLRNYSVAYNTDGSLTLVNVADGTDVVKAYLAKMGTEFVYLRANNNNAGLARLRYGIQSNTTLLAADIYGGSTDGSWTSTVASSQLSIDGFGSGNGVTPARVASPQATVLGSGLFSYAAVDLTGGVYFAARSDRLVVVQGARNAAFPTINGYLMLGLAP